MNGIMADFFFVSKSSSACLTAQKQTNFKSIDQWLWSFSLLRMRFYLVVGQIGTSLQPVYVHLDRKLGAIWSYWGMVYCFLLIHSVNGEINQS
jgi:hypothetical protein